MNNESIIKELKQDIFKINACLTGISKNYYKIGEALYNIKSKYYIEQTKYKGYNSITEFAENEFGFSKTKTSYLVSIYERFFINKSVGFYQDFKYSQLREMLSMSEEQIQMCKPEMTIKEILNIKSIEFPRGNCEQQEYVENSIINNVIEGVFPDKKEDPEEPKTTTIIVTELPRTEPKENKTITIDVKTETEQNNSFVPIESQEEFYKKEYLKALDQKNIAETKIITLESKLKLLEENISSYRQSLKYFYEKLESINGIQGNSEIKILLKEISNFGEYGKLPKKVNFFENVV